VKVSGSGTGNGTSALLVLRGETLAGPAAIDPMANPGWNITFDPQGFAFEIHPAAVAETDGVSGPLALVPGVYSLSLRVQRTLASETGLARQSMLESNRVPLSLAPAIASAAPMAMADPVHIEVDMDAAFDVTAPALETQLSIGADIYRKVDFFDGDPAKDAGTFIARNGHFYQAAPAATLPAGTYTVRVAVNGVDAPPHWMEIP
jgi:hypothetical protein